MWRSSIRIRALQCLNARLTHMSNTTSGMAASNEPPRNRRVVRVLIVGVIIAVLLYGLAHYLLDGSGGFIQLGSGTERSR